MLNGVAILAAAPMAAFLALQFQLLLCLGVSEAKKELDAIVLDE